MLKLRQASETTLLGAGTYFILILIACRPTLPKVLKEQLDRNLKKIIRESSHCTELKIDYREMPGAATGEFNSRIDPLARLRNQLLDQYLRPDHTHVLWIDADIVKFPPYFIDHLLNLDPNGITAPCVLLEGTRDRFYDTGGFVENGKWCENEPPWFKQTTPVVELDSVGSIYMVPAKLFQDGGRYSQVQGYAEHYSICKIAKNQGRKVLCDQQLRVYHACLSLYEEGHE